jgi:hypothetical protein
MMRSPGPARPGTKATAQATIERRGRACTQQRADLTDMSYLQSAVTAGRLVAARDQRELRRTGAPDGDQRSPADAVWARLER